MQAAKTLVRIQPEGQTERTILISVPILTRVTLMPDAGRAYDGPVRRRRSSPTDAGGRSHDELGRERIRSHAETAVDRRRPTWYLAEGSTAGPSRCSTCCRIRMRRPRRDDHASCGRRAAAGGAVVHPAAELAHDAAGRQRGAGTGQHRRSGVIIATQPIIVERAMYLDRPGQPFVAGHESAGVTAPVDGLVPRRRRDRAVLRAVRADCQPESAASDVDRRLPAPGRDGADEELRGRRQRPLHHLGRRGAVPGSSGNSALANVDLLDARAVDQRRADHRRAGDVVAAAGLVRGAQLAGHDRHRHALGAGRWAKWAARAACRPTC